MLISHADIYIYFRIQARQGIPGQAPELNTATARDRVSRTSPPSERRNHRRRMCRSRKKWPKPANYIQRGTGRDLNCHMPLFFSSICN